VILTLPRTQPPALPEAACWGASKLDFLHPPLWQSRASVEHDEAFQQPLPKTCSNGVTCSAQIESMMHVWDNPEDEIWNDVKRANCRCGP
jgi:hypothetical protein